MQDEWKDKGLCLDDDPEAYFDIYEEDVDSRGATDLVCSMCPVMKQCFAAGISGKSYGVWGGVYLENGKISREFNRHKTKDDWSETWKNLTMDKG
jgi:hypothetical protein